MVPKVFEPLKFYEEIREKNEKTQLAWMSREGCHTDNAMDNAAELDSTEGPPTDDRLLLGLSSTGDQLWLTMIVNITWIL